MEQCTLAGNTKVTRTQSRLKVGTWKRFSPVRSSHIRVPDLFSKVKTVPQFHSDVSSHLISFIHSIHFKLKIFRRIQRISKKGHSISPSSVRTEAAWHFQEQFFVELLQKQIYSNTLQSKGAVSMTKKVHALSSIYQTFHWWFFSASKFFRKKIVFFSHRAAWSRHAQKNQESASVRISNINAPIDRGQNTESMCGKTDIAIHFQYFKRIIETPWIWLIILKHVASIDWLI